MCAFGVVIFVHEFGHFIVARFNKIKVSVFSIGFGPRIMSFKDKKGTNWQIAKPIEVLKLLSVKAILSDSPDTFGSLFKSHRVPASANILQNSPNSLGKPRGKEAANRAIAYFSPPKGMVYAPPESSLGPIPLNL